MIRLAVPYYESDRGVAEYLLFHYGGTDADFAPGIAPPSVGNFPEQCIRQGCDPSRLPPKARALDLGCAVGRAAFELARHCSTVLGIDYSHRFIAVARELQAAGRMDFAALEEGELTRPATAIVPPEIDRQRVRFEQGDALALPADLGTFDVVLLANLIDRLPDPRHCLQQIPHLLNPGGQLIITSPYTWLPEYTAREKWLGGYMDANGPVKTRASLETILAPHCRLVASNNIPFLIREHARKFQFSVAEATLWIRA